MPCEISLAALAKFLDCDHLTIQMQSMNNLGIIEKQIIEKVNPTNKTDLLFIGSYYLKLREFHTNKPYQTY